MKTKAAIIDLVRDGIPFEITVGLADGEGTYSSLTIPRKALSRVDFDKYRGTIAMAEAVKELITSSEAWSEIAESNKDTLEYDAEAKVVSVKFSCDDEEIGGHIHRFGESASENPVVDEMYDLLDLIASMEVVTA